jgi:hypothetical protein
MNGRDVSELLYDFEAALRLVDSAIEDIREPDTVPESPDAARLKEMIVSVLASLRESRGVLQRADELVALVSHIQNGDVAIAQLSHAAAVLTETEHRLAELATALRPVDQVGL